MTLKHWSQCDDVVKEQVFHTPYIPAVTSALMAEIVSLAMTFLPTTAWIGISNSWRGITWSRKSQPSWKNITDIRIRLTKLFCPKSANALFGRLVYNQSESIYRFWVEKKHHLTKVNSCEEWCGFIILTLTRLLDLYPPSS